MRVNEQIDHSIGETKFRNKVITKPHYHPTITNIQVEENKLIAQLSDGRELSIPVSWFKTLFLQEVNWKQLKNYEIFPGGHTIFFPDINEPLHIRTFTDGLNARCCC